MNTIQIIALAFLGAYVSFTLIFGLVSLGSKYFGIDYPVYKNAATKVKDWMFFSEGGALVLAGVLALGSVPFLIIITMILVSFTQLGVVYALKQKEESETIA